ncbi:MAG: hypothetical protein PVG65_00505 [Candidatus Thorarchaeota archaeon]|jgi:hypothetical protein
MKRKKIKHLQLIEKKNKLLKKIVPLLEKFTDSTGLIVTQINAEPRDDVIFNEELDKPTGIRIAYTVTMETKV